MKNNKHVYVVEVDYDCQMPGHEHAKVHAVLGVYEDKIDAVRVANVNVDSDMTEQDILDGLDEEGVVEVWWHPMIVDDHFAKRVYCTITEHTLITKSGS